MSPGSYDAIARLVTVPTRRRLPLTSTRWCGDTARCRHRGVAVIHGRLWLPQQPQLAVDQVSPLRSERPRGLLTGGVAGSSNETAGLFRRYDLQPDGASSVRLPDVVHDHRLRLRSQRRSNVQGVQSAEAGPRQQPGLDEDCSIRFE